jgi:hypothetical protein
MDNTTDSEKSEEGGDKQPNVSFSKVFNLLEDLCGILESMTTRGEASKQKAEAIGKLDKIHDAIFDLNDLCGETGTTTRLGTLEKEFKELKSIIKETMTTKTYAQATTPTVPAEIKAKQQLELSQRKEQWKMEKAKYQVTLSVSEEAKETLTKLSHKEITEKCQHTIEQAKIPNISTTLNGVNKLPNHLRLQCKTEEQAKLLLQIDWSKAFNDLTLQKPKYGVVIHGVPKAKVNLSMKTTVSQLQEGNKSIPITSIVLLRCKPHEETTH